MKRAESWRLQLQFLNDLLKSGIAPNWQEPRVNGNQRHHQASTTKCLFQCGHGFLATPCKSEPQCPLVRVCPRPGNEDAANCLAGWEPGDCLALLRGQRRPDRFQGCAIVPGVEQSPCYTGVCL